MTVNPPESDATPVRPALSPWMIVGGVVVCLCAGLLILGLVVAVVLRKSTTISKGGIAEIQLPNQTWLVIEEVTWGQRHRLQLPPERVPWWQLNDPGARPREFLHQTGADRLVVWMSHRSADKKKPQDLTWWGSSEIIDGRGRVIRDDQAYRHTDFRNGSGGAGGDRPFQPVETAMPHARDFRHIAGTSQFPPIRPDGDGNFQLVIRDYAGKEITRFQLKYPGAAPQSWKPVPLPVTIPVGDLNLTVNELTASVYTMAEYKHGATQFGEFQTPEEVVQAVGKPLSEIRITNRLHVFPQFTVKRGAQTVTDWQVATFTLTDEVGVRNNSNHNLDWRDSAWKLTGNIARNEHAQFTLDEVWKVKPLTIPELNQGKMISEVGRLQRFDLACLAIGRGRVTHTWGSRTGSGGSRSYNANFAGESVEVDLEQVEGTARLTVSSSLPHVVMRQVDVGFPRRFLLIRATSSTGEKVQISPSHDVGEYVVYFIDPKFSGQEIHLEVILHESRSFELYVPPPAVPKELETEYPVGSAEPRP